MPATQPGVYLFAMRALSITPDRLSFYIRMVLLVAALFTYLISPDDVVWHFIKMSAHPRVLEHIFFGIAASMLGISLLLELAASAQAEAQDVQDSHCTRATLSRLLQSIGIGSLLPLPGFLLLVIGNVVVSLSLHRGHQTAGDVKPGMYLQRAKSTLRALRWRNTLATHIGLCLAFLSMVAFSIVLIDRVADVLFATTALVSIAANLRRVALRAQD